MATTRTTLQILWSSAESLSVAASGNATSDVFTPQTNTFQIDFMMKASNDGTPGVGDTMDVYLLTSGGDPDSEPDVTNEFPTPEHSQHIGVLDTNIENPAITYAANLPAGVEGQIRVVNNSGGRAITISIQAVEYQSA